MTEQYEPGTLVKLRDSKAYGVVAGTVITGKIIVAWYTTNSGKLLEKVITLTEGPEEIEIIPVGAKHA